MAIQIKDALTANGNLRTEVHKNITGQFADSVLVDVIGLEATPNGDYAMVVAQADGLPVYVRVNFVVTLSDPFVAKAKAQKKAKDKEPVEVPNLF
jgi:hypothetical protein